MQHMFAFIESNMLVQFGQKDSKQFFRINLHICVVLGNLALVQDWRLLEKISVTPIPASTRIWVFSNCVGYSQRLYIDKTAQYILRFMEKLISGLNVVCKFLV